VRKAVNHIAKTVYWVETALAVFIILTVIISGFNLVQRLYSMLVTDPTQAYELLQGFLTHVLLLVIGLELAMMLIKHTPGMVIEVMLYAIARKMLIYTTNTYEIAIGVVALAGLFAIRKFLYVTKIDHVEGVVLSGMTPVKDANRITGLHIPEDMAPTLGDLVLKLAADEKVNSGNVYRIGNVEMEVIKAAAGIPEKIKVTELTDSPH